MGECVYFKIHGISFFVTHEKRMGKLGSPNRQSNPSRLQSAIVAIVEVLIAECQTTGDQQNGGGIHMLDGSFTMRGGAIRNCEALNGDGGCGCGYFGVVCNMLF